VSGEAGEVLTGRVQKDVQEVRTSDYVFRGGKAGKPLSNMAMTEVLGRMGRGDITVHGFRSTFRDVLDRIRIALSPLAVTSSCAGHQVTTSGAPGKVEPDPTDDGSIIIECVVLGEHPIAGAAPSISGMRLGSVPRHPLGPAKCWTHESKRIS
jgi:hypothetical protein